MRFPNINHDTSITLDINGCDISIKSRPDDKRMSGWAVITFTPSCSIRCDKIHRPHLLEAYAETISAAAGSYEDEDVKKIKEAILSITFSPPELND